MVDGPPRFGMLAGHELRSAEPARAQGLFVTFCVPSRCHLSRAFRKLETTSRTQLSAALGTELAGLQPKPSVANTA